MLFALPPPPPHIPLYYCCFLLLFLIRESHGELKNSELEKKLQAAEKSRDEEMDALRKKFAAELEQVKKDFKVKKKCGDSGYYSGWGQGASQTKIILVAAPTSGRYSATVTAMVVLYSSDYSNDYFTVVGLVAVAVLYCGNCALQCWLCFSLVTVLCIGDCT